MIENKDTPAFPVTEETTDRIDAGTKIYTGVSKLEFFACNAPVDIPGWFTHVAPEKKLSRRFTLQDINNDEDRKVVRDWQLDAIYDLPEHLQWYSDRVNLINTEQSKYEQMNGAARYFQWRRYYAEQLLTELSKPQP